MGVKGLFTFVRGNSDLLFCDYQLRDTRVVIDGNNLLPILLEHYHVPVQFGGDYDRFADACKEFFQALLDCEVKPYIVFDGGYDRDERKFDTIKSRAQRRRDDVYENASNGELSQSPILMKTAFKMVLKEMDIDHVSCHFEADKEIAVLAKKWSCPIVSKDSDFLVCDLEGGIIMPDDINPKVHVYDEQTGETTEYFAGQTLTEHQKKYVPVKLYKSEYFTDQFPARIKNFVLPMLASVLGNDFVDREELRPFYWSLPSTPHALSFKVPNENKKLPKILNWLKCIIDPAYAINEVAVAVRGKQPMEREKLKQKLQRSMDDYLNLEEFSSMNLVEYFEARASGVPGQITMDDYNKEPLPQWFIDRRETCQLSAFLQNATVLHWVPLDCQVECLEYPSSYKCCIDLRQVIYGILKQTARGTITGTKQKCREHSVVELDRSGANPKLIESLVVPRYEIPGYGPLPHIQDLERETKADRNRLLFRVLNVPDNIISTMNDKNAKSTFLIAVAAFWFKTARPILSKNKLNSLLVCTLFLHMNRLRQENVVDDNGAFLHEDISAADGRSSHSQLDHFRVAMDKYTTCKPGPIDVQSVHGFSQFQACLRFAIYLNELLLCPVAPLNPSVIFSGTIVYNLCRGLSMRENLSLFEEILGRGSPFHAKFIELKRTVSAILQ